MVRQHRSHVRRQYKFKDWSTHRTNSPGNPVTLAEKEARAEQIATLLSNNTCWNSHGRFIAEFRP
jgi:hypothetical protein